MAPVWRHEALLPNVTDRAVEWTKDAVKIDDHFLDFPQTASRTLLYPKYFMKGRNDAGPYGDFVVETDRSVGAILDALDRATIRGETQVIATSDNGLPARSRNGVRAGNVSEEFDHGPNGDWRGLRGDAW